MISKIYWLFRTYGLYGFVYRTYFELSKKLSLIERRFPAISTEKIESLLSKQKTITLNNHGSFINFDQLDYDFIRNHLDLKSIDLNMKGIYRAFSNNYLNYGAPINWDKHPITKKRFGTNIHWAKIENTPVSVGEIKYFWDIARFSFSALHVLAYHCTKDDKYFYHFWECFISWAKNNPPEMGINWRCGQEISIRVLFWIISYFGFFKNKNFSTNKKLKLLSHIAYSIKHIYKNINFSYRTLRNNHVITEASMLYIVAVLFPFLKESKKWKKIGKHILEKEAMHQIFSDGTYIQYSFNYHRLILELFLLDLLVAKKNQDDFSHRVKERLLLSVKQLFNVQSELNGQLPNFGSNDGTQLLPFALKSDYLDFRPQLQAIYFLLTGKRLYPPGEYDIYPTILLGDIFKKSRDFEPLQRATKSYIKGGLHILRGYESFAFYRCGNYKSRPAQSDMFHFDFWYNGQNVLVDSGTYLYSPQDKSGEYFIGTAAHNTVNIDHKFQMQKGPRFIWYKWTKVSINKIHVSQKYDLIEAEHLGYKPIIHRRGILRIQDTWIIVDDIFGKGNYSSIIQRWIVSPQLNVVKKNNTVEINVDNDNKLIIHTFYDNEAKTKILKAHASKPDGWISYYFGTQIPTSYIDIETKSNLPLRLLTCLYKDKQKPCILKDALQIAGLIIRLNKVGTNNIFLIN